MTTPTNDGNIVKRTSQYIDNTSFDETTGVRGVAIYGTPDGTNIYRLAVNSDGTISASIGSSAYDIRLDDTTTANVTYIGKAALTGSAIATSSAVWQVQKIDETTGMIITWADGDSSFNNIWDNRASLTYA